MTEVYLALGSNMGNSSTNITKAIKLLRAKLVDLRCAPFYSSKAVGYTDQPDFINTAVVAQTDLNPQELLKFIKDIEQQVGRVQRFRWGPREIDIDIIFYGLQRIDTPELTVPHPRFAERDFVLRPLVDLNPSLVDPSSGLTVTELLNKLDSTGRSII